VSILGDRLSGSGSSSADQTARNKADSDASNKSTTKQGATPKQTAGSLHCGGGCGGAGQEQNVLQAAKTKQRGRSWAYARQGVVNL
jgi:hypothetical protein